MSTILTFSKSLLWKIKNSNGHKCILLKVKHLGGHIVVPLKVKHLEVHFCLTFGDQTLWRSLLSYFWRSTTLLVTNDRITQFMFDWWSSLICETIVILVYIKSSFFITPCSRFDNTLYFDITLMPNGMIVLWSAFI